MPGSIGRQQQEPKLRQVFTQQRKEFLRDCVDPLEVFDHQNNRPAQAAPDAELAEDLKRLDLQGLGAQFDGSGFEAQKVKQERAVFASVQTDLTKAEADLFGNDCRWSSSTIRQLLRSRSSMSR